MIWQNPLLVRVLLLSAGITGTLTWIAWQRRGTPGAGQLALMLLAATIWSLTEVAERLALDLPGKIFWSQISYLGIVSLPVFWLLFVAQRVGQRPIMTGRGRLLWLIPLITLGMVLTNPWHGLHWADVTLIHTSTGTMAIYGRGPWFWVHLTYSYLLLFLGAVWLFVALLQSPRVQRYQLAVLLFGTWISWTGNGIYLLRITPDLDLTAPSFALAGIIYAWAIFRFDLLNLAPIARETLIENIDDGVLVLNLVGHIVDLNPAAQRLLGTDARSLLRTPAATALRAWTDAEGAALDATRFSGNITVTDGAARFLELHRSPLHDPRGAVAGNLLLLRDVTAKQQADRLLQESQRAFATLVSNLPGMVYRCLNDAHWTMQFVSQGCVELTGYQPDDLIQNHKLAYADLIHPDERQQVWDNVQTGLDSQRSFQVTYRIVTASSEEKWVWEQGRGIYDEAGTLTTIEGFVADVTPRKHAEDALRESEARYRAIFEHAKEGISYHLELPDGRRKLLDCNPEYVALSGYSRAEFLCAADTRQLQVTHSATHATPAQMARQTADPSYNGRFSWRRPDGRENLIEYTATPLQTTAGTVVVGIDRDITERARAEQAEREQRMLAEALHEAAMVLNSSLDLDEVLDRILAQVGRVIGYEAAVIYLIEGAVARMARSHVGATVTAYADSLQGLDWEIATTANMATMVATRQPVIISDTHADPTWITLPQTDWIRSHAGAPICIRDTVVGFVEAQSKIPGFYQVRDGERLAAFANQAALAIQNARLFEATRRHAEEMTMLNRIGLAITAGLNMEQVLRTIDEQCLQIAPADGFYVALYEASTGDIRFPVFRDEQAYLTLPVYNVRTKPGLAGAVIAQGRTLYLPDTLDPEASDTYQISHVGSIARSYLGIPLRLRGQTIGVLSIQHKTAATYTAEQIHRLEMIATQAVIAIDNARLYEAAQHEKQYLETLIASSPGGIVVIDPAGQVIRWNPAAERIFGYTPAEAIGRNIDALIARADDQMFAEATRLTTTAFDAQRTAHTITQRNRKDGSLVDVEIYGASEGIGVQRELILHYYDISERQAARQAIEGANRELQQRLSELDQANSSLQARNEELDAFAHTVAHDLRSPLGNITGYADILRWDAAEMTGAEVADLAVEMLQQGRRMRNIIDELLLLASVRKEDVALEPLDMADIVAETQERLTDLIVRSEAEIITPQDWPDAIGHGPWVVEVWINYLSNAITYGGQPPVIELDATELPDGLVQFWVRDNGPGIAVEDQERIFVPFTRLAQARAQGHGLGLSIVQRIITKLGGQVGVESEVAAGSRFFFTLPSMSK